MGRHRTAQEKTELGAQARRLREQGWSRSRIAAELHVGGVVLSELLDGTAVPDALRRPRARDDLRERARALRREGRTYDQIADELGVAKSSCSLWLRDLPHPGPAPVPPMPPVRAALDSASERRARAREMRAAGALLKEIAEEFGVATGTVCRWCTGLPVPARARHGGSADHVAAMAETRWAPLREARDARREELHLAAATQLGSVTSRDLLVALAVSYWCEGAKAKPWNPVEAVHWMNSDPGLVTLFLAGLREAGVPREQVLFRLSIHEGADEVAARTWWAQHVGVDPDCFAKTTLKRHNPRTVRHNADHQYRGCLRVDVRQSRELYQHLEGLLRALVGACQSGGGRGLGEPADGQSAVG